MKRQIHAVRGHEQVAVPGHDIKLGRGGIREIEFFVQTQQLIFGGRRPHMRGARTLDMLGELHADGWVSAEAVDELSPRYLFLRRIEHRLQMVADEQTQRLPFERAAPRRVSPNSAATRGSTVSPRPRPDICAGSNITTPGCSSMRRASTPALAVLSSPASSTIPRRLTTLRALGFQRPEPAAETIRGWHFGRRAAVRSPRAREVLTELTPALLEAFAGSGDPDAALAAFDAALARMTAAVELFSILRSNAHARIVRRHARQRAAPRQCHRDAPACARRRDRSGARGGFEGASTTTGCATRVEAFIAHAPTYEEALNRARDFAAEEMFLIGVKLLSGGSIPTGRAAPIARSPRG